MVARSVGSTVAAKAALMAASYVERKVDPKAASSAGRWVEHLDARSTGATAVEMVVTLVDWLAVQWVEMSAGEMVVVTVAEMDVT